MIHPALPVDWGNQSPASSLGPQRFVTARGQSASMVRRLDVDLAWLEANELIVPDGPALALLRGQPALAAQLRNLCETLRPVPGIKLHIVIHREPDEGHDKPVVVYSMPKGHLLLFPDVVPVAVAPTLFKTIQAFQRELESFRTLPTDWNSYRSRQIAPVAIEHARHLLWLMLEQHWYNASQAAFPEAIVPVPNGGVQFVWRRGGNELEVEIGPNGDYGFLAVTTRDEREDAEEAEQTTLATILARIAAILTTQ